MRYSLLLLLPLLFSCVRDQKNSGTVRGYAPVYLSVAQSHQITTGPPAATVNAGKIYAYNNYLFQVEQGKGIHVIDNSVPGQSGKIAFINIPGCSEIAIKANYLYTNNVADLVVLNLANITAAAEVNRQANAFPQIDQSYPPFNGVYFECVDASKGFVVGWEEKILTNPKCRR